MTRYILDRTLPYDNLLMTEGAQSQSFTWGNELIAADDMLYLQDHLGSPIRLIHNWQTPLAYDAFGQQTVGMTPNVKQPFGFTGYQMDSISGLSYAQARYYSPEQGRFTAQDVIKGNAFLPESINPYTYCRNTPMMLVDKDGRAPFGIPCYSTGRMIYAPTWSFSRPDRGASPMSQELIDVRGDNWIGAGAAMPARSVTPSPPRTIFRQEGCCCEEAARARWSQIGANAVLRDLVGGDLMEGAPALSIAQEAVIRDLVGLENIGTAQVRYWAIVAGIAGQPWLSRGLTAFANVVDYEFTEQALFRTILEVGIGAGAGYVAGWLSQSNV